MAETIEESLRSILDQVNDDYEVLIVDDGSTDGSLDIIQRLETEYQNLRHIVGSNDNLAEARNQSFREAKGKYVLESLDVDDKYDKGITNFVKIFHQLNSVVDKDFYFKGHSINIAPRRLLLQYPYRSMTYGEDADLWRRLFAVNKIIWLEHEPFYQELDPDDPKTRTTKARLLKTAEFRSGVTFRSYARYEMEKKRPIVSVYRVSRLIRPYLTALLRGRYKLPDGYEKKEKLENEINQSSRTIEELEQEFGFEIDKSKLSKRGVEIFFKNTDYSPLSES